MNLSSGDSWVVRFHKVEVGYPILDVRGTSKREDNLLVTRVVRDETEGSLCFVTNLCYTCHSWVTLAGLSTIPTLDEVLIAIS